jgi:CheY-like chemotaxis protein
LVVEDDALIRLMIVSSLEDLRCTVVATAFKLNDAVQKATHLNFDVGLLDINVAGTMIYPVGEILLARHIPFVFATAYDAEVIPANFHCVPLLTKPFDEEQLRDQLCLAMRGASH